MEPTPQAMPSRPACLPQERRGLRVRSRSSATSTHREAFTRDRQYQQRLASLTDLSNPSSHTHFYPGVSYPASKATVNAITIQLAKEFPGIRINAVEPGYTRTDLNGRTAPKPWRKARRSSSAWPKSVPMDRPEPTFRPTDRSQGEPSPRPGPTHRRPCPENEIRQHADPRQVRRRPGGRQDRGAGADLAGVAGCPRAEDDHFLRPGDGELCSNDSFRAEGELH
jgi:hypothetical protein